MQKRRTKAAHDQRREGHSRRLPPSGSMSLHPVKLGSMGCLFITNHEPVSGRQGRFGDAALGNPGLQTDAQKRRGGFSIGGKVVQPLDQPPRQQHQPGGGMVEVNSLKPLGNGGFRRQNENCRSITQHIERIGQGSDQPFADHQQLIIGGDQP